MSENLTFIGLHYWAGSGRAFDAVAERLAAHNSLLAPDLAGFGTAAPQADCSVAAYADQVSRFIGAHVVGRYVMLGHSMGGKIALALASRQPAGLAGVVLLSPSPPSPEPMSEAERQAAQQAFGLLAAAEETVQHITARPLPKAMRQQVVQDNLRSSSLAYHAWLQQGSREDISGQMGSVRAPCLILAGDQDQVLPPAVHQTLTLPLLPLGTALEVLTGAGHLLPYEAPAQVAAHVRAFSQHL